MTVSFLSKIIFKLNLKWLWLSGSFIQLVFHQASVGGERELTAWDVVTNSGEMERAFFFFSCCSGSHHDVWKRTLSRLLSRYFMDPIGKPWTVRSSNLHILLLPWSFSEQTMLCSRMNCVLSMVFKFHVRGSHFKPSLVKLRKASRLWFDDCEMDDC